MGYKTPEVAVTKVCPYLTMGGRLHNCMAGDCMLWRWKDGIEPEPVDPEGRAPPGDYEPPSGFCGMAGAPEKPPKEPPTSRSYTASDRPAAMAEKAIEGTA